MNAICLWFFRPSSRVTVKVSERWNALTVSYKRESKYSIKSRTLSRVILSKLRSKTPLEGYSVFLRYESSVCETEIKHPWVPFSYASQRLSVLNAENEIRDHRETPRRRRGKGVLSANGVPALLYGFG